MSANREIDRWPGSRRPEQQPSAIAAERWTGREDNFDGEMYETSEAETETKAVESANSPETKRNPAS